MSIFSRLNHAHQVMKVATTTILRLIDYDPIVMHCPVSDSLSLGWPKSHYGRPARYIIKMARFWQRVSSTDPQPDKLASISLAQGNRKRTCTKTITILNLYSLGAWPTGFNSSKSH